ncbi:MAG: hypothetical protein A3H25_03245 [Sphingomonadales bacterium RIFCSPLOWO2_12_FULL_63_15]|nr:MAG: hypothetical protein A3H25_03245 [Sphingomonadales bacterium RIFCSPLOWO2_12_FULL_63_15]
MCLGSRSQVDPGTPHASFVLDALEQSRVALRVREVTERLAEAAIEPSATAMTVIMLLRLDGLTHATIDPVSLR